MEHSVEDHYCSESVCDRVICRSVHNNHSWGWRWSYISGYWRSIQGRHWLPRQTRRHQWCQLHCHWARYDPATQPVM